MPGKTQVLLEDDGGKVDDSVGTPNLLEEFWSKRAGVSATPRSGVRGSLTTRSSDEHATEVLSRPVGEHVALLDGSERLALVNSLQRF